jgi:hypothetical protein
MAAYREDMRRAWERINSSPDAEAPDTLRDHRVRRSGRGHPLLVSHGVLGCHVDTIDRWWVFPAALARSQALDPRPACPPGPPGVCRSSGRLLRPACVVLRSLQSANAIQFSQTKRDSTEVQHDLSPRFQSPGDVRPRSVPQPASEPASSSTHVGRSGHTGRESPIERSGPGRSARTLIPFSIRRSIAKSPNSIKTRLNNASRGVPQR